MPTFFPLQRPSMPANIAAAARKVARRRARTAPRVKPVPATGHESVQFGLLPEPLLLQTKLEVSQPGDELEREADRVAESVMRMPFEETAPQRPEKASTTLRSNSSVVQRACASCRDGQPDEDKRVQRSAEGGAELDGAQGGAAWSERFRAAQSGGGEPLPKSVRQFMERRFGASFDHVSVHHDETSSSLAKVIGARAFTVGNNVFFKSSEYAPGTERGRRLIAHELAHTLQQSLRRPAARSRIAPALETRALVQRQAEDLVSGGARVSYLADDIVAGTIADSGTLVRRLRDFSRAELSELLAQVDYKASQRLSSDPVLDGLIEAAKEEIQGALAGRVILKPLPPCTQSFAAPTPAAFAANVDLELVRAGALVLRPGSSSEAIQLVQQALRSFGCAVINKDLLPRFGADGSYGNEMTRAVREFQAARGLSVDGTVGPKTLAALDGFVGLGATGNRASPGTFNQRKPCYVIYDDHAKIDGSLAWRFNNPGNIGPTPRQQSTRQFPPGALGWVPGGTTCGGRVGLFIFDSRATGEAASTQWFDNRPDSLRADKALLEYSHEGQTYLNCIKGICPNIVLGRAVSITEVDPSSAGDTLGALRTDSRYECMKNAVLQCESRNARAGTTFTCASTADSSLQRELRGLMGCDASSR